MNPYIGSLAKFIWTPSGFTLHDAQYSLHFDKPQKNYSVENAKVAEEEQELEALAESLDKTCTRYKTEISAEKTKLMTNSANGIQRERDKK